MSHGIACNLLGNSYSQVVFTKAVQESFDMFPLGSKSQTGDVVIGLSFKNTRNIKQEMGILSAGECRKDLRCHRCGRLTSQSHFYNS